AAQRVDRRGVIAGERLVGAEADAALEAFERDVEDRRRLLLVTEPLVGRTQARVQLYENPVPQRMLRADEEIQFALVGVDRPRVLPLERRQVSGADPAAGDEEPLAPGEERFLELGRARRGPFAPREVAHQRRAVREL